MAAGRGCSFCPGALPKKVLHPQELAVMLEQPRAGLTLPVCGSRFLGAHLKHCCPRAKARSLHLFLPQMEPGCHGCPWYHPQASHPGTFSHPTPKILSSGCFLCFCLIFSLPLGAGTSRMGAATGRRKREGRRWDHATSCSRRLLQTFLQHIQPHGTFCVTKASKNINHQN